jgi:thioredoxin-dependent peroxiredoxin
MNALSLVAALAFASAPKVGDVAPDFSAKDTDGNTVTLSTMLKDGPVILAFFPKAFTPG